MFGRGRQSASIYRNSPGGMTVAVLACLGGLVAAYNAWGDVQILSHGYSVGFVDLDTVRAQGMLRVYYSVGAIVNPGIAILLIGGTALLFGHKRLGKSLVIAGCVLDIGLGIFGAVVKPDLFGSYPTTTLDRVIYLVPLIFPIITIALVGSAFRRPAHRPRGPG